jgi:hypothetical protein
MQALQSPLKRDGEWHQIEPSTPNKLPEQAEMPFAQLADPPTRMPRLAPISTQFSNNKEEQRSPLKVCILYLYFPY